MEAGHRANFDNDDTSDAHFSRIPAERTPSITTRIKENRSLIKQSKETIERLETNMIHGSFTFTDAIQLSYWETALNRFENDLADLQLLNEVRLSIRESQAGKRKRNRS